MTRQPKKRFAPPPQKRLADREEARARRRRSLRIALRAEVIAGREKSRGSADDSREKLKASLKRTEVRIKRVVNAIVAGGHNESLVARLKVLEAEGERLKSELAALDEAASPDPAEIDDDVEARILATASEIEKLLNDPSHPDAPRAREMVRSMIERITVIRHESGAVEISVRGEFAGVMEAAGLLDRYSLERALGREKAPEPEAAGG